MHGRKNFERGDVGDENERSHEIVSFQCDQPRTMRENQEDEDEEDMKCVENFTTRVTKTGS